MRLAIQGAGRTLAVGLAMSLGVSLGVAATATEARAWEFRVCADADSLPFSNSAGEGYDNAIAELLADELGAELSYVWLPNTRGAIRQQYVQAGHCDVLMGVLEGQRGFLTSHAYYRTGYVFLYPEGADFELGSLDDAVLKELRIGVPGGARKLIPPSVALVKRGVVDNLIHFDDRRTNGERYIPAVQAVAEGSVDAAIVWGPFAGQYAGEVGGVVVTPVRPEIDLPFIPMVASLTIGFRPGDEALRDDVNAALAGSWDAIEAVLEAHGVPQLALPRPVSTLGSGG